MTQVASGMLWANLHLLFWVSLFLFATGWMGENHFAAWPSTVYGVVLLMAAFSYTILQATIIRSKGTDLVVKRAVGADRKGRASLVLYVAGVVASFHVPGLAQVAYMAAALLWLVPNRRIEAALRHARGGMSDA